MITERLMAAKFFFFEIVFQFDTMYLSSDFTVTECEASLSQSMCPTVKDD